MIGELFDIERRLDAPEALEGYAKAKKDPR